MLKIAQIVSQRSGVYLNPGGLTISIAQARVAQISISHAENDFELRLSKFGYFDGFVQNKTMERCCIENNRSVLLRQNGLDTGKRDLIGNPAGCIQVKIFL